MEHRLNSIALIKLIVANLTKILIHLRNWATYSRKTILQIIVLLQ